MIGREREKQELIDLCHIQESQFVAIYGRRRIGKTYLVRETFNSDFAFHYTGIVNISKQQQLENFYAALIRQGLQQSKSPKNWFEAFYLLRDLLEQKKPDPKYGKKIVFLDELPWMDNPRSNFVSALGYFWNSWAAWTEDIILIVCGSATSWIISKIVRDKGGLHNRLTHRIYLEPFTLYECELYCNSRKLNLNRTQIAEIYMIFGGIPYYWSLLKPGLSVAQNIDNLCFSNTGELSLEFDQLYASIYKKPEDYIAIVKVLSGKKAGMTRDELIKKSRLSNNGKFSEMIQNLDHCGFIRIFYPFGKKEKGAVYQLMDNFTLFHLHFIETQRNVNNSYWSSICGTPTYNVWIGLAFERLCLEHLPQIRHSLGISGIGVATHSWQTDAKNSAIDEGAQIDLLMVRNDNVIDIFEMKYSTQEYHVTDALTQKVRNVTSNFISTTKTKKGIRHILVTPHGVYPNRNRWFFDATIPLSALFHP